MIIRRLVCFYEYVETEEQDPPTSQEEMEDLFEATGCIGSISEYLFPPIYTVHSKKE